LNFDFTSKEGTVKYLHVLKFIIVAFPVGSLAALIMNGYHCGDYVFLQLCVLLD